ncbi:MAG TPA: KH domain-containing protein [Thermoplasmata archaeon]|nr:KH domain-containing protein [Thermoplasmata archaeon]
MPVLYARVPEDRIGAVIGPGGRTKREIATRTGTEVDVDTDDGEVRFAGPDSDPMGVLKARDIVLAIGRGFSPERAFRLLKENTFLGVLDIKFTTGHREKSSLRRIRARAIGTRGKARSRIEELSGCSMSVYGSTVALIGEEEQLERATRAVELLLRGSEHSTVFQYLARARREAALDDATRGSRAPDSEA